MTAIIVLLSFLLAAAVVGTVIGVLKYRKISKTADNINSFVEKGKDVAKNVENDVSKMRQTADNVNSLVNDGRKAAGEIGEEFNKIKQTIADVNIGNKINNLLNVASKEEITK